MAGGNLTVEDQKPGDQVQNLRESLPEQQAENPQAPRMPFKTAYVLTRDQEDAMVEHALLRIKQLEDQLGRVIKETGQTGKGQGVLKATIDNPNSFMGKREKYTLRYYNHVQDRVRPDTIYEHSNLTLSLSQRITRQMVASATSFFFGQPDDSDWFSTSAVGAEDETLSDKVKKHSRWKVDQCGIKHQMVTGTEFAFVRGESAMKVTHQERSQIYKRTATILMKDQGEPLLDANGDYIVQGDEFVQGMAPPAPGIMQRVKQFFTGPEPGGNEAGATPDDNGAQLVPTGNMVLKRDGVTVMPQVPVWKEQVITRKLVTFEGPEAALVYYKDFLCPETAADVQQADLICQLYDMDIMRIAQMFRGQYAEGDSGIADLTSAIERLRDMTGESNIPKSADKQPRTDFRETDTTGAKGVPLIEMAECYLTYDADGDGVLEEIMFVLDRRNKAPIYYEYLANVTVRGIRPYYVVRPIPVDGRWYGIGSMEYFDPEQEFLDLQVNRHNFATSEAGMVKFWEPSATMEGSRDPNLKLHHGKTYSLRDGKKGEDALSYIQIPTDQENLQYLIDLFMQAMQLKSGKINPGDQKMSGLPSSETATGENIVTESGDELFSLILAALFPGIKSVLQAVVDVIYANMNRTEVFNYFNGEADEILSLDPSSVRDLALNVTLELSRTEQQKAMQQGDVVTKLIDWFYGLPFEIEQRCVAYVRQRLKGFGVSNSDKIIDPIDMGKPQDDKPSSEGQMLAALMKAGAPTTVDQVNAVMEKAGLPPTQEGQTMAAPEQPPPGANGEAQQGPPQSAA